MADAETLVESWHFYEEMARQGEYGEIVSGDGEITLTPAMELMAGFFVDQLKGRARILDLGCGLGFPALVLAPHVGSLVALDAAPTMVRRLHAHAQRLGLGMIAVLQASAKNLPFKNEAFDGAVLCGTLASLSEPEMVLEATHAVTRPGAVVACIAQNFAIRLERENERESRWFRLDGGELSLQVVRYLENPYRIRNCRYLLREDSDLYRQLVSAPNETQSWRLPTECKPGDLPEGSMAGAIYGEEVQYDPASLVEIFERMGFRKRHVSCHAVSGMEYIFASFERP